MKIFQATTNFKEQEYLAQIEGYENFAMVYLFKIIGTERILIRDEYQSDVEMCKLSMRQQFGFKENDWLISDNAKPILE